MAQFDQMWQPVCASRHAPGPCATMAGKIAEAVFPDFRSKVQTASGLLILRPSRASTHGFRRPGPDTAVTGSEFLWINLGAAQGWLGTRKRNRSNDLD